MATFGLRWEWVSMISPDPLWSIPSADLSPWLARFQPWQHALRYGFRGHRPRRYQHHPRSLRGRINRNVLGVQVEQEVGRWFYHQRILGRLGGYHLPLLLGHP